LIYSLARYTKYAWAQVQKVTTRLNRVSPEELFDQRHLVPSSTLVTGVTNICNAKCNFCAYPKAVQNKTLQTGVMSFEVFKKAVDEWAAAGGEHLDLTPVVGDPLIDPGLLKKIEYAVKDAKIKNIYLTTNAILINRNDTYKALVDFGVNVFISTQGANKEMYEKVYGVNHYGDVISGVRNLLEYNRSKGEPSSIAIRFRNAEKPSAIIRSKDFIENIKPYLSQKVRFNFTVDYDNWGGSITEKDIMGVMKLRKIPENTQLPCMGLFGFAVRHDGSVRLCGCRFKQSDMDDLVVGNLRDQSLAEISKSDKTWGIIKGFYSGERPETCKECTFYRPINRKWLDARASHKSGGAMDS